MPSARAEGTEMDWSFDFLPDFLLALVLCSMSAETDGRLRELLEDREDEPEAAELSSSDEEGILTSKIKF